MGSKNVVIIFYGFRKFIRLFRVNVESYPYIQYITVTFCHIVPDLQLVNPNIFSLDT